MVALNILPGDGNNTTVYFRGTNTFTGGVTLNSGWHADRTYIGNDAAFGTGPVRLKLNGGATCHLEKDVTMSNAFSGDGRVIPEGYTLTCTGSIAPMDADGNNATFLVTDDLKGGILDFQGTYYWGYDAGTNDVISVQELAFGSGSATLVCSWDGAGSAPRPDPSGTEYVLFTYVEGTDPVNPSWTITPPPNLRAEVFVDTAKKQVILRLLPPPAGTFFFFR